MNNAVVDDMVGVLNGNATGVAIFDSGSSNAMHAKPADVLRLVRIRRARGMKNQKRRVYRGYA